jgi:hypothetical protein
MKHLTIIAGIITSVTPYSLAMKYHANFNNNLSNETIIIYDTGNGPCKLQPKNKEPLCSIVPRQTKAIDLSTLGFVLSTKTMDGTSYMFMMQKLPKNINFTHSKKTNYIDIVFDSELYGSVENKHRDFPKK